MSPNSAIARSPERDCGEEHRGAAIIAAGKDEEALTIEFTKNALLEALEQCDYVSDRSSECLKELSPRIVRSVALSERLAVVRRNQDLGTYVIFRGTESPGLYR